jgi:hypothetical protein
MAFHGLSKGREPGGMASGQLGYEIRVQERFVPKKLTWIETTFFSATNGLKIIPAAFIAKMQRLKKT